MDGEAQTPRVECPRCKRPERVCYCAHVTTLPTRTRVVFLQHPREHGLAIGTAHMASLCLPGSELHVGADFRGSPVLARLLADRERPAALLYPGDGAIDVGAHPPSGPITLIVVDGTWPQAKKLVKNTPELAALPRYTFVSKAPSEYRIRREPDAAYLSTIESMVVVLGALEGDADRFTPLLAPFRAMVDTQLDHVARFHTPRVRKRGPRPPRVRGPAIFRERPDDLVCVSGEANAWPFGSPERIDVVGELVHWLAHRPSTGETFEAVIAPRERLAPNTPTHIGVSAERLANGIDLGSFRAAWHAFVRESDVLCAWGDHPLKLLARALGTESSSTIDLRHVTRVLHNRHLGSLETFGSTLGALPSMPREGRGGRRLARTTQALSHIIDLTRTGDG